ncbi:MAG: ribonuclease P protein component [Rhodospirillaceae bacterium]|nr:ribonuclease P protein component [Rhodospirillaceae bacterium]|tara:strand:- start:6322 stop:6714 length:393 start_codon:yes stop_codon:yes gene_type:complete
MVQTLQRLKQRREFLDVAEKGVKFATPGLVLQALKRSSACKHPFVSAEAGSIRVGFTVTKKIGNAVIRNRVKRRLRAAATAVLPAVAKKGFDFVLIGRAHTKNRLYEDLTKDLKDALKRVSAHRNFENDK